MPKESESTDEELALWDPVTKQKLVMPCPGGCLVPEQFLLYRERIWDFPVRADDVWLCGFLRSGTTWTQELTWLLVNNLDFETAKKKSMSVRVPLIERVGVLPPLVSDVYQDSVQHAEQAAPPRCIKSHVPVAMLPRQLWTVKPKIIYVARNPKDMAVSFYHLVRLYFGADVTFEQFSDAFFENNVFYTPYWDSVLQFWNLRNEENILWNTYEDMQKDLPAVIRKIARFLGKSVTDEQVRQLQEHLSFERMRNNPTLNNELTAQQMRRGKGLPPAPSDNAFIRKGVVGGSREVLSPELHERYDRWIRDSTSGTDYVLPG